MTARSLAPGGGLHSRASLRLTLLKLTRKRLYSSGRRADRVKLLALRAIFESGHNQIINDRERQIGGLESHLPRAVVVDGVGTELNLPGSLTVHTDRNPKGKMACAVQSHHAHEGVRNQRCGRRTSGNKAQGVDHSESAFQRRVSATERSGGIGSAPTELTASRPAVSTTRAVCFFDNVRELMECLLLKCPLPLECEGTAEL